jgi:hypothetical protein
MLIAIFCSGLFSPEIAIASGGGPTQPEVQGFTPIGVSDMVDPFTGDFSYNIPLMDVEGYPINIAYNSGITMDQEASWVGLGWNLNVGSIMRNMRGLPDDFNGDIVTKVVSQKPQTDIGVSVKAGQIEIFGKNVREQLEALNALGSVPGVIGGSVVNQMIGAIEANNNSLSLNLSANVNYNNYRGWGVGFDLGPSFNLKKFGRVASFGLNLSLSSENGPGFSPSVSLSKDVTTKNKLDNDLSFTISGGGSFNSRAGLREISYGGKLRAPYWDRKNGGYVDGKWENQSSYNVGLRHYSPTAGPSMTNSAFVGNFTAGPTLLGVDMELSFRLSVNRSVIANTIIQNPAYGFFHLNNGQQNKYALLDFNRDNDGAFTQYTPYLASAHLTGDLFSVQAQGISGSYRAYRNEVGYVFDPATYTSSGSVDFGLELGMGGTTQNGFDISGVNSSAYSGPWSSNNNKAAEVVKFENPGQELESFALQEANESSVDTDNLFGTTFSKTGAEMFELGGIPRYPVLKKSIDGDVVTMNNRDSRIKRNQLMSYLTVKEVQDGLGLQFFPSNACTQAQPHHIGEITQLGTDGRRYVFGLPAYSLSQYEATMSVGENLSGNHGHLPTDRYNGRIDLGNDFSECASTDNKSGIDQYFSSTSTPAYAHSYMLTAVLSDDYVDADEIKGPSNNDIGTFVKFDYQKVEDVRWRNPVQQNEVYYNEGLKTDMKDDQGSFIYGEKELWYVKAIETKNYVAVFVCEDRADGFSASGKSGGLAPTGRMKLLKKISLYPKPSNFTSIADLEGLTPIQEVNFVYNYSLCPGYPANATGGGKLTLKEIYFTYQGSYKMKRSSYKFEYNGGNAAYNMKAVDRWGNYKPTGTGDYDPTNTANPIPTGDFPYTTQDKTETDDNVSQWTLTDIYLPSGGKIHVDYESDDYAYVQNKRAAQMYPIAFIGDGNGDPIGLADSSLVKRVTISKNGSGEDKNSALFIKMKAGHNDAEEYVKNGQLIYFKTMVNVGKDDGTDYNNDKWELIGGYGFVDTATPVEVSPGDWYLRLDLKGEKLMDNGAADYSPITKQAIQFARMNLSRTINDVDVNGPDNTSESGILNFAGAVASAFTTFDEMFVGPNLGIYNNGKCRQILTNRSFVRLMEPTGHKLGGGLRVKAVKMYDNWKEMVDGGTADPDAFTFGQEYDYTLEDGTSSGVASYEPSIGGDENSMFSPEPFNNEIKCAPDQDMYFEKPLMESQFPSPSVGYSRVTVRDLSGDENSEVNTGKVVKEFYTAKDFPVIVKSTNMDPKHSTSFLPFSPKYEFMSVSQGFSIELNDMHGKPKAEYVYSEYKPEPISSVMYDYQCSPVVVNGEPGFKLDNQATVINRDGTTATAEIGVKYEAVADFRESSTQSIGFGPIDQNINTMFAGPWFLVIPTVWGHIDISEDRLRTATLNKVINRFGLVKTVRADQDGSLVETRNLAYDAESGQVLATQTTNNFNDAVYSLAYPAYWKYDGMGAAYNNIGYTIQGYPMGADGFVPCGTAGANFVEGDEVMVSSVSSSPTPFRGWVTEVNSNGIRIVNKEDEAISLTNARIKVIRSGRRNKQTATMFNVVSNENPLSEIVSSTFTKVLNSGAVEFKDSWNTFCNCFDERGGGNHINAYANGTKGNWRPVRSYTYLTERSQTNVNGNSNIRRDGVFTSFSPFYAYNDQVDEWHKNPSNWTFVSEVTEFSPNGNTLETADALGRYSASLLSYRNSLTTAVAANASLEQIAEGSFEDFNYRNCMDQSIFFNILPENLSSNEFHSGRNSLHVGGGTEIGVGEASEVCNTDTDCTITLTAIGSNAYQLTGRSFSTEVTVVSGSGSVSIDGNKVLRVNNTSPSGQYFEVIVKIIDKDGGCNVIVKFYTTPPSFTTLSMEVLSVNQN